jgi:hypothetical protein
MYGDGKYVSVVLNSNSLTFVFLMRSFFIQLIVHATSKP